jgi:hypothetical protein
MRNSFVVTKNVSRFNSLCARLREPSPKGCGLGCVFGLRGRGKTETSLWYSQRHIDETIYIRCHVLWTPRNFLEMLAVHLGQEPARRVTDLIEQIRARLKVKRPLVIIDEADYLLKEGAKIETVRDLYDTCLTPFLLIGMEDFQRKIHRYPHLVDRIRDNFFEFRPLASEDVTNLAGELCEVNLTGQALEYISNNADGSLRRVETFVKQAEEAARVNHLREVDVCHLKPAARGILRRAHRPRALSRAPVLPESQPAAKEALA